MKSIYINGNLGNINLYRHMAFPTAISSLGNINSISCAYKCREQVISEFGKYMTNLQRRRKLRKVLNKSRIIVFALKNSDMEVANLEKVLKTINIIEDEIGMSKTSIIHVVSKKNKKNMLMFEGSKKWYRSSQTMSLWLMLIRICLRDPSSFYGKNFKDLVKIAKVFPKYKGSSGIHWAEEDRGYIHETIHTWIPLMKNINKIFPFQRRLKDRYNNIKVLKLSKKGKYLNKCYVEGIHKFATGITQSKDYDKFKEIMKENS